MSITFRLFSTLFISYLLTISCNFSSEKKGNLEEERYEIYSLLIRNLPPMPPPAPPAFGEKLDTLVIKSYIDSISKIDINISISTTTISNKFHEIDWDDDYKFLRNKSKNSSEDKTIDVSKIHGKVNQHLQSNENMSAKVFEDKNILWAISFSDVIFDEDINHAMVIISSTSSPKSGDIIAYIFKKDAEDWIIIDYKSLGVF